MRLGSLCTGYGGLDLAAESVFGPLETVFVSEIDAALDPVLAARFPNAPNLGDLTEIADPPPVDILTAGFPCQPFSQAGLRTGTDHERWLFDDIADLIGRMDPYPGMLLLENVPGLLTTNDGDAMGRVVHRLAALGYVGRYRTLSAADVGACHRRRRVFIVATLPGRPGIGPDARRGGRHGTALQAGPPAERPREKVALPSDPLSGSYLPTPTAQDSAGSRRATSRTAEWTSNPGTTLTDVAYGETFGEYFQAVERHAAHLGRPPPPPTVNGRLSPVFVEWMMMLPAGWVTDPVTNRAHALRILGNGVVPAQAAAAYSALVTL